MIKPRVVILTGVGRSGTRALHTALGLHPDLDSTGCENNVLGDLLETSWRNMTVPSRVCAMRTTEAEYLATFRDAAIRLLRPGSAGSTLLAYTALQGVEVAEHLFSVFPHARLLALVRDGVSVVSSRMLFESFRDQSFESHCRAWARQAEIAAWAQGRPDAFVMRHESIVADPQSALVEVWRWLGVEDCRQSVAFLREHRVHPTRHPRESSGESADLASRTSRIATWTSEQCAVFDDICGPMMSRFRYTTARKRAATIQSQSPRTIVATG